MKMIFSRMNLLLTALQQAAGLGQSSRTDRRWSDLRSQSEQHVEKSDKCTRRPACCHGPRTRYVRVSGNRRCPGSSPSSRAGARRHEEDRSNWTTETASGRTGRYLRIEARCSLEGSRFSHGSTTHSCTSGKQELSFLWYQFFWKLLVSSLVAS